MPDDNIEFTQADSDAFIELAKTLKRIHTRLMMEGYTIEDGVLVPPKKEKD